MNSSKLKARILSPASVEDSEGSQVLRDFRTNFVKAAVAANKALATYSKNLRSFLEERSKGPADHREVALIKLKERISY